MDNGENLVVTDNVQTGRNTSVVRDRVIGAPNETGAESSNIGLNRAFATKTAEPTWMFTRKEYWNKRIHCPTRAVRDTLVDASRETVAETSHTEFNKAFAAKTAEPARMCVPKEYWNKRIHYSTGGHTEAVRDTLVGASCKTVAETSHTEFDKAFAAKTAKQARMFVRIHNFLEQPKSLADKNQYRDCLTKSLTLLCKEITENSVMDGSELDLLISEKCITGDEMRFINPPGIGPIQGARRLLSLMLHRDYRAMFIFLTSLLPLNEHVVGKVLQEFDCCLRLNYKKPHKCTLCHLDSRVDIALFADDLLSFDEEWLHFYNKVIQTEYVGPSKELWREFVDKINADDLHSDYSKILLKALEACGFHSDIVAMLEEDAEKRRSSFLCRCSVLRRNKTTTDFVESSEAHQVPLSGKETFPKEVELINSRKKVTDDSHGIFEQRHDLSEQVSVNDLRISENINKANTESHLSGKKSLYETKDRKLHALLNAKQVKERKVDSKNVGQGLRFGSKFSEKNHDHETELLKPVIQEQERKMDTLKNDRLQDRSQKVMKMTSSDPPIPGTSLVQMETLKDDTFLQNSKIKTEYDCPDGGVSRNYSLKQYQNTDKSCKSHQPQLDILSVELQDNTDDKESNEHQIDELKIGHEIDRESEFSSTFSTQSDREACFSEIEDSVGEDNYANQCTLVKTLYVSRPGRSSENATETQILNVLIIFALWLHLCRAFATFLNSRNMQ